MVSLDKKGLDKKGLDKKGLGKDSLGDMEMLKIYSIPLVILMFLIVITAPIFKVPSILNLIDVILCAVGAYIIFSNYIKICFGSLFGNKEDKTEN